MFILHFESFVRLWEPNVSVQVKIFKLASISPRWTNHAPNNPKQPQIANWTWLKYVGELLHLGMRGCGNVGGLESKCGINCTKSSKKWTKSTSNAPSQPSCPHSMNGSALAMMRAHMWLVD